MTETTVAHATHSSSPHGAGRYLAVWVGLLALTALTYLVRRADVQEPWHLVAALVIAVAKASLVVLFFMHLWEHAGAAQLTLLTAVALAALLIGLVLVDNSTRFPYANPPRPGAWSEPPGTQRAPPLPARGPAE
jgi:cytochrome c oxidase subunit 4